MTTGPTTVVSILRAAPLSPETSGCSVSYAVTFSAPVNNLMSSDFALATAGSVAVSAPVAVSGSGASYTVSVSGIHGSGELRLDLIDDDSIVDTGSVPLGGAGLYNGSFQGQSYLVDQVAPYVVSINRSVPSGPITNATNVSFAATFNEAVVNVDAADFAPAITGSLSVSQPVAVSGSGASYTVSLSGLAGNGTLGLGSGTLGLGVLRQYHGPHNAGLERDGLRQRR